MSKWRGKKRKKVNTSNNKKFSGSKTRY
jgi:hypothetical protein